MTSRNWGPETEGSERDEKDERQFQSANCQLASFGGGTARER